MSESTDTSNKDGKKTTETTSGGGEEFTPITSQEALNDALKERLARERAKFSDYNDLKAKAGKYDELEAANKSEIEKANDRVREAEQRAAEAASAALRSRIQARHGVSDEDADLFLTGTDEETLTKQAERLAEREADAGKPRSPKPDPNQGRSSNGPVSTADQFAAAIGGHLNQ